MLSTDKCIEKCRDYLRERHPKVWARLFVLDEAVKAQFYNLLAAYLQQSAPELNDNDDVHLLGAFGSDDNALAQLIDHVSVVLPTKRN